MATDDDGTRQSSRFVRGNELTYSVTVYGNSLAATAPQVQNFFASFKPK